MNERIIRQVAMQYPDLILPPYDAIMDMDGFDAVCAFSRTFSGTSVYVPSLRTIFGKCIEKSIIEQYNGTNVREMVQKYGYSERHVRDILLREK